MKEAKDIFKAIGNKTWGALLAFFFQILSISVVCGSLMVINYSIDLFIGKTSPVFWFSKIHDITYSSISILSFSQLTLEGFFIVSTLISAFQMLKSILSIHIEEES